MPTFKLNSGRIINYDFNKADGPFTGEGQGVVVLANPLCASLGFWDRIVTALRASNRNFSVLRFDYPGHGGISTTGTREEMEGTTFDSLAEDVKKLLDHLEIRDLWAWIGVSMGASLGVVFAYKFGGPDFPIHRLIVCDTTSCSPVNAGLQDTFGPRVAAAREAGSMDKTVDETLERWFGRDWIKANEGEAGRLRGLMRRTTLDGYETCCIALRSASYDIRPMVKKLGPDKVAFVMYVVGENDANLPQTMDELRATTGGGRADEPKLHVIKGAGHVSFIDGEKQWLEVVLPALENL